MASTSTLDIGVQKSTSTIPCVTRAAIKVIAESVGIAHLKDEVADALAPDVEFRLRDLVQEAIKFQKHGRRETLSKEDLNFALRLRNCEPLYGFTSPDPPRFCRALTPGVFYLEDPELNLADMLAEPLPRVPVEPSFTTHWLAVNGVQPSIPQNPTEADIAAAGASRKRQRDADADDAGGPEGAVTPLARHALTSEEQAWLDRVTAAVQAHEERGERLRLQLERRPGGGEAALGARTRVRLEQRHRPLGAPALQVLLRERDGVGEDLLAQPRVACVQTREEARDRVRCARERVSVRDGSDAHPARSRRGRRRRRTCDRGVQSWTSASRLVSSQSSSL